jgi:para-aminobenzoate synthetase component 1
VPSLSPSPLYFELDPCPRVIDLFQQFCDRPGCLLLDSARQIQSASGQPLGRYSFLMADPFDWLECPVGSVAPLQPVRKWLAEYQIEPISDLPPFQGGVAGLFSYDLNQSFERLPTCRHSESPVPALAVGCYDTVIAWDHQQNRAWIVSTGFPETDPALRRAKAESDIEKYRSTIDSATNSPTQWTITSPAKPSAPFIGSAAAAPGPVGLTSNFTRDEYVSTVQKCIDSIYAGDIFQVNLSQQLRFPANCHASELYARLRACNPAPFAGYFDLSGMGHSEVQIVSASPERFVAVRDRVVETRPIKGTRPRTGTPMVDIRARGQLEGSVKDRAENTMIVDLMRNDLSRCCTDDSIVVTQLCELEEYQSVLHLVSAVEGKLKPDCDLVDLVRSIFPGGSITGAPKIRAMEIIAEREPHSRGAYCGSLGYLGFDGGADLNILIRTITASDGWWQIPVGGGIVSQSDPRQEYEETLTKAAGLLRALV